MNVLRNFTVAILILFGFTIANAQRVTIKLYPKHGFFIKKLNHPQQIRYNYHTYYRSKGIWYKKRNRGFVIVQAPIGIAFKVLPRGSKVVWINKHRYYTFRGVRYTRTRRGFIVGLKKRKI